MNKITISTGHPDAGRVYAEAYDAASAREAALRGELATIYSDRDAEKKMKAKARDQRDVQTIRACELQQRLTVAEQRAADLKKLLCDVINEAPTGFASLKVDIANRVNDALKPAAEGEGS